MVANGFPRILYPSSGEKIMALRLPDFPSRPDTKNKELIVWWERLESWWGGVQQELDSEFSKSFQGAASKEAYMLSNVSINRSFTPTSATDTYTATALVTLLNDLREKGIIG
jgi:hypothetical protein